ncbi:unnamed protein product [Rhizoctonia solani]|uniref:N-acetyltransferase domain-containing protein n=1 Tax=Rhizoctonia solani TaxID=456999 RepID=A0A8H3DJT8_9AGAM|nr:unnamed protein product [Rhizoctonia solani]
MTMVNVVNNYVPPPPKGPVTLPDPNAPYDLNFRFPVRELESDRLKLVPFVPSIHGQAFFEGMKPCPELVQYLPWNPFNTLHEFEVHFERLIRSDPTWCVFAALDKSKGMKPCPELLQYLPWNPFNTLHEFEVHFERLIRSDPTWCVFAALDKSKLDPNQVETTHALAGTIGYLRASPELSSVEIGYVIILPAYQRTFVSTHAIGLLLDYALQKPSDGGLGLRRVQWQAHAHNAASIRAAQRMGLKLEGVLRWERTVPIDKDNGIKARDDDVLQLPGRHSAMLAMCWDDWEEEGRAQVRAMMARRS